MPDKEIFPMRWPPLEGSTGSIELKVPQRKKPYERPSCTLKSLGEAAGLFMSGNPEGRDGLFPRCAETVVVAGYEGSLSTIGRLKRISRPNLKASSTRYGRDLLELHVDETEDVRLSVGFLLDLRGRDSGGAKLFEPTRGNEELTEFLPLIVLVDHFEDLPGRTQIDWDHCWQIKGSPNSDELARALRMFLRMCAASKQGSLRENSC